MRPAAIRHSPANCPPLRLSTPTVQWTWPGRWLPQTTIGRYHCATRSIASNWFDWPISSTPSSMPESTIRSSQSSASGITRLSIMSYPLSVRASARWPRIAIKNGSDKCWRCSCPNGTTTPITLVSCTRSRRAIWFGRKPCARASAWIRSRVSLLTSDLSANARDTVPVDTPARRASSAMLRIRAGAGGRSDMVGMKS